LNHDDGPAAGFRSTCLPQGCTDPLDVAEAQSWSTQWTLYDALDRVDTVVTTYDDGTYAILDIDQANEFSWATQFWLYDSGDNVIAYQLIPDG
jgi:hypothetical protein